MSSTTPPEVLWAQRSSADDSLKNVIYLTINVPDLQPGYSLTFPTPSSVSFKALAGSSQTSSGSASQKTFEIESLELFDELDLAADKKEHLTGKSLQVLLTKKNLTDDYWPRLTKDKRVNFVKTDFAKWVDQDEQNGSGLDDPFASTGAAPGSGMDMDAMMAQMGMGGMGGFGGGAAGMDMEKMLGDMKDLPKESDGQSTSSEDEELPPLEEASPAKAEE